MLRLGVLGAGNMARIHASAFSRTGKARIAVFYAPDDAASRLAERHKAYCARSLDEFFEHTQLDAVVIATPTHTHAELLEKIRQANVHIFCEKPLARTEEELQHLENLFDGYPKIFMVGHTVRFFPEYEYARNVLSEHELGQLGVLRLGRCGGFDLPGEHWLFDFSKSGGVVLDMMIHDLDFADWAAGPLVSVFARRAHVPSPADDFCLVIGRLADGAIIHLEGSWAEPPNTFYYFYEIAASEGILDYDSRRSPAYQFRARGSAQCHFDQGTACTPTHHTPYDRQAEAFVDAIMRNGTSPVSLATGARAVRLALAVLESAATGRPVDVAPPTVLRKQETPGSEKGENARESTDDGAGA